LKVFSGASGDRGTADKLLPARSVIPIGDPIEIAVTGLDPVIHLLRRNFFAKIDGCPDQVRA
jgi:hypothetical protein